MNYSQIMSPRPPLPRKVGGHDPPAPMGAPPLPVSSGVTWRPEGRSQAWKWIYPTNLGPFLTCPCFPKHFYSVPSSSLSATQSLLPPIKEEVHVFSRVCLSVCSVLARLLKNACMDLDEMLRVDRCRDMDELINFSARSRSQSGCQDRIAFSDIV